MIFPVDTYILQFLDFKNQPVPNADVVCASLPEAHARALSYAQLRGSCQWRILQVVCTSEDDSG